MNPRRVAGALALAVLLGGVGEPAWGLSRAEFVKAANAICKKAEDDGTAAILKLKIDTTSQPTPATYKKIGPIVVSVLTSELDKLAKLDPPAADKADVKKMLGFVRAYVAKVKKNPQALANDETENAAADKIATKLGLANCGSS